jgi:hypothetical protein
VSLPASRRVLVLAIAVAVACALAIAWLRRAGSGPALEERAREKAVELQEKVRELTH